MATQNTNSEKDWHKKFAVNLFNLTWDLLDKAERSTEEDDKMLQAAYASRFHWGEIGTPLEFERGEWQISRVCAVLDNAEAAVYHAQRCLEICQAHEIGDFDIAFAYEALARAHAVSGDVEKSKTYIELGEQAGAQIEDKDNRAYFLGELRDVTKMVEQG